MNDLDFFRELARLPGLPEDLLAELGVRQLAAHRAQWRGGTFTLARTETGNTYVVDNHVIKTDAAGMHALALAVLNPGRDVPLGKQRTRRAWRAAIDRALGGIQPLAPGLARALGPPEARHAPGLSLSVDCSGRVWAHWARAPNVRIDVEATVP